MHKRVWGGFKAFGVNLWGKKWDFGANKGLQEGIGGFGVDLRDFGAIWGGKMRILSSVRGHG